MRVALCQVVQVVELGRPCLVYEDWLILLTISEVGQFQPMLFGGASLCQADEPRLWEVMQFDGGSAVRHVFMGNGSDLFAEEVDQHEFAIGYVEGDHGVVVDHVEGVECVIFGAVFEELTAVVRNVDDGFGFPRVEALEQDISVVEGRKHLHDSWHGIFQPYSHCLI